MLAPRSLLDLDGLLRGEGRHPVGGGRVPWGRLLVILGISGATYGAAMGSFGLVDGRAGQAALQALYSGIKVPLLVVCSMLLCLPNFYVVNAVLGLRSDFAAAFRGILSAQATFAVCLAALAPVTLLFYASIGSYHAAKLVNVATFLVALFAAQKTLTRHYAPLLARDARHRVALLAWPALYMFVAGQLAFVLRPFLGNPDFPTEFLRDPWWGNVYGDLLWALRGL
ncbi:MAG: hypothetical protein ACT4PU_08220 [Planctomycetota bacterium]